MGGGGAGVGAGAGTGAGAGAGGSGGASGCGPASTGLGPRSVPCLPSLQVGQLVRVTIPTSTRAASARVSGAVPVATWGKLDPTEDLVFRALVGVVDDTAWTCDVFRLPSSAQALAPEPGAGPGEGQDEEFDHVPLDCVAPLLPFESPGNAGSSAAFAAPAPAAEEPDVSEVLRRGKVLFGLRDFEAAAEQYEAALRLVSGGSSTRGGDCGTGPSATAGAGVGAGCLGAASGVVCGAGAGAGSAGGGSGGAGGAGSFWSGHAAPPPKTTASAVATVTVGSRVLVAPAGDAKRPPRPAFVSIVDDDDCTADVMYEDGEEEEDGVSFTRLTLIGDGSGLADKSDADTMSDGDGYSGGGGSAAHTSGAASEALVAAQLTAHSNLARCLLKLGRPAAACGHLDMAIGLSAVARRGDGPDDLLAAQKALCTLHYLHATADMGRRRPFDAERSIALALSLCPDNKQCRVLAVDIRAACVASKQADKRLARQVAMWVGQATGSM